MKRRGIIATLFGLAGVARAQQATGELFDRTGTAPLNDHACNAVPGEQCKPKPKNNECPVCGTMAEPYKQGPYMPNSQRIDCAYCNATFKQFAE